MNSHALFVAVCCAGLRVRVTHDDIELTGGLVQHTAALFGNYKLALQTDVLEEQHRIADDVLRDLQQHLRSLVPSDQCPGCEECR